MAAPSQNEKEPPVGAQGGKGESEMKAKKTLKKRGVLFHILVPLDMAEKIYELSEKMDITYSDIIRQALREYFERLEGSEKEGLDKTQRHT